MSATPLAAARPDKRQREDSVSGRSKITRAPGATSVAGKQSTLGSSLSERDCLNLSLTSLHWLCDLRLTGGIIPSEVNTALAAAAGKSEALVAAAAAAAATAGGSGASAASAAAAGPALAKPEHSYAELISLAMQNSPKKALTLNEIYNFVMDRFPYYRTVEPSWKNSIRYNLSQNKLFVRLPMDTSDKAATWALAARVQTPATAGNSGATAAAPKGKKGSASSKKQAQHQQSRLAICEAAGDDWEDIEDVTPLAGGMAEPVGSDDDWIDAFGVDPAEASPAADAATATVGAIQHPWADDKRLSVSGIAIEPSPRASAVIADPNFAASLASCLSIFPLSSSALAAESLSGGNWELALAAGAADAGRLPDVADHLADAPIPRDWL